MIYKKSDYNSLPTESGVYEFVDKNNTILYVGKANNLKARVSSYFTGTTQLGGKTQLLVEQINKIKITIVESELEALLLEAFYIKKFRPKYNARLKDNKSYIKIRITMQDKYPKVLLARNETDDQSLYYGPYPNSSAVKLVLKTVRRIFPYQSVPNHPKRICLYNHLGLCPCPPVNDSDELLKIYRRNIKGLIRILEGESKKILKELEKERNSFSKKQEFEQAAAIQKKIQALSFITTPFHKPFEYHINPNLRVDIRKQELDELMSILNAQSLDFIKSTVTGVSTDLMIRKLDRIECYDISNTQGTNATGSMVVFIHGEKDSSQYRKFRIRKSGKPDDFGMMREVLARRLKHEDWYFPDLFIIDGGKGQVSSALQVLSEQGIQIPVIGLAKREETIILPEFLNLKFQSNILNNKTGPETKGNNKKVIEKLKFSEISLPKNSPALHLIMRIRDEAHRFAITYHKKLRSKHMTI